MEDEQNNESEHKGGARGTALKAAAAAAATGAAAFAARKAMSGSGGAGHLLSGSNGSSQDAQQRGESKRASQSVIGSLASGGWDAARDALVPLAEDAAAAAGKYLADKSPDFVRDRIVPRFIASFNEASGND